MTAAEALRELMQAWDKIMTAAKERFPCADEEELYRITSSAMTHALGLRQKGGE